MFEWRRRISVFDITQARHRLLDATHGDHFHAGDRLLRAVGFGNQRPGETQLGGFLEALLATRRRANLARQANLAKYNKFRR